MKYLQFIIFVILAFSIVGCSPKAICGNGVLEEGETRLTCCQDVGCLGEQKCEDGQCIDPTCDECQYLEEHKCKDYECCDNQDCKSNEECINHDCNVLNCGDCEYSSNHKCKKAACCNDNDCNDEDIYTTDKCSNAGTENAKCENIGKTCDDGTPAGECSSTKIGYVCMAPFMELQQAQFCDEEYTESDEHCRPVGNGVCTRDPKMIGSKKILIVEFVQEDLEYGDEMDGYNLIDFLNNEEEYKYLEEPYFNDGYKVYSFNVISEWFEEQAGDYGADLSLDVDIEGPFEIESNPPERGANDECSILDDYFRTELEKHNIDPSDYDGTSIVFLQNGDQIFWSCARNGLDYEINYVNVDWVENLNMHTRSIIQTVIHETTHLFGGADKYKGYTCLVPIGIPEPNKNPLYPQTKACVMCGNVMADENSGGNPSNMDQLVICEKTAKELGWTS